MISATSTAAPHPFALPDFPDGYLLRTERLELRAPSLEDVNALWPYVTDARITRFLAWDPHPSKEVTKSMLCGLIEAQEHGKAFHWVIVRREEVVGIVSLIDVRRTHRCWTLNRTELAYWLASDWQGFGYATEACDRVLQFAFENLGFHKVVVYHATDNPPSGAVAQRLNFRYVGEEVEAFQKDDVWHDLKHYEMLNHEYFGQRIESRAH